MILDAMDEGATGRAITLRAAIVALAALVFLCWFSPREDLVLQNMISGGHSAPLLATVVFIIIVVLNGLVGAIARTMRPSAGLAAASQGAVPAKPETTSPQTDKGPPPGPKVTSGKERRRRRIEQQKARPAQPAAPVAPRVVEPPPAALSSTELLFVYCILLAVSGIPSMGLVDYLIPQLIAPYYYATSENRWAELFHPYIPAWLVPSQDEKSQVIQGFVTGKSFVPWGAWIPVLAVWSTFVLALYVVMISTCAILRRQWVEHERLAFPLVKLPVTLASGIGGVSIFRQRLFWIGAALPLLLYSWNALADYRLSVPVIPLDIGIGALLSSPPWSAMGSTHGYIYPALIGFFYFVPLDVTVGIWVFYIFVKFQRLLDGLLGISFFTKGGLWYASSAEIHQSMGALAVLTLSWIWVARRHLWALVRRALGRTVEGEEVGYPLAIWGVVGGLAYMALFFHIAGMSFTLALTVFVVYLVICIGLTRLVAQAGLMYVQSPYQPTDVVLAMTGAKSVGLNSLTLFTFQFPFYFDMAGFLMPSAMNVLKIGDEYRMERRRLVGAVFIAIVLAMAVSFASFLTLVYEKGGNETTNSWYFKGSPVYPLNDYAARYRNPKPVDTHALSFVGVGAAVCAAVMFMQRTFFWWGINPLGYLLVGTWVVFKSWFSCLLAWLIKFIILKYGGGRLYHRLAPFFIGLIFAGFAAPALWAIIDLITGRTSHVIPTFPPD